MRVVVITSEFVSGIGEDMSTTVGQGLKPPPVTLELHPATLECWPTRVM